MKIKLDIDCTPEEARAFLGLPDVAGIQNEMLEKVRDRMVANLKYADPQEMFRFWFPGRRGAHRGAERLWSRLRGRRVGAPARRPPPLPGPSRRTT